MSTNQPRDGGRGSIWAVANQRCPNCRRGIVYRHASARNNLCPACGIRFEREPGYYTGAIYVGILIAFPVIVLFLFLLLFFFRSLDPMEALGIAVAGLVPLLPAINRISYVIWIAIDRGIASNDSEPPPPPDPQPTDLVPPPHPGGGARHLPEEEGREELHDDHPAELV